MLASSLLKWAGAGIAIILPAIAIAAPYETANPSTTATPAVQPATVKPAAKRANVRHTHNYARTKLSSIKHTSSNRHARTLTTSRHTGKRLSGKSLATRSVSSRSLRSTKARTASYATTSYRREMLAKLNGRGSRNTSRTSTSIRHSSKTRLASRRSLATRHTNLNYRTGKHLTKTSKTAQYASLRSVRTRRHVATAHMTAKTKTVTQPQATPLFERSAASSMGGM
jgi:hypothetical protein